MSVPSPNVPFEFATEICKSNNCTAKILITLNNLRNLPFVTCNKKEAYHKIVKPQGNTGPYSDRSQTSKIELFQKIVTSLKLLNIFAKSSILDV